MEDASEGVPRQTTKNMPSHLGALDSSFGFGKYFLLTGWLDTLLHRADLKLVVNGLGSVPVSSAFQYFRNDVHSAVRRVERERLAFAILHRGDSDIEGNLVFRADGFVKHLLTTSLTSSHEMLVKCLSVLADSVGHANDSSVLYSVPDQQIEILQELYSSSLSEQSGFFHSTSSRQTGPVDLTFVFVVLGTAPILPLIFDTLRGLERSAEVIIVNNSPGSRAECLSLLLEAELLNNLAWQYIEPEFNVGFGAACNMAADNARSPWLIFHNNDVYTGDPGDYRALVAALERSRVVGAVQRFPSGEIMHRGLQTAVLDPGLTGGATGVLSGISIGREHPPGRAAGPVVSSGSLLGIERALFREVGGFSTRYLYGHFEDIDLGLRLDARGIRTEIVENVGFLHSEGSGSMVPQHIAATVPTLNRMIFTKTWTPTWATWTQ